jgi:quercetin dioxygenase-like cupin family protein
MRRLLLLGVALCLTAASAFAQDPVKVDPKHYTVVFENDRVRVLKIHYGPHEKSVMHSHPDAVVTFLTDEHAKFTLPDGTSPVRDGKAGDAMWTPAETHLPENLGDKSLDGILVELKSKSTAHTSKKAPPPTPKKQGP